MYAVWLCKKNLLTSFEAIEKNIKTYSSYHVHCYKSLNSKTGLATTYLSKIKEAITPFLITHLQRKNVK